MKVGVFFTCVVIQTTQFVLSFYFDHAWTWQIVWPNWTILFNFFNPKTFQKWMQRVGEEWRKIRRWVFVKQEENEQDSLTSKGFPRSCVICILFCKRRLVSNESAPWSASIALGAINAAVGSWRPRRDLWIFTKLGNTMTSVRITKKREKKKTDVDPVD